MSWSRSLAGVILTTLAAIMPAVGCVTLDLREATAPYYGRIHPDAPTIAVCSVKDRREDPGRFGRVGWNLFSLTGSSGQKFRNALMTALNNEGYNLRFVGPVNVLDRAAASRALKDSGADLILTAAVLELRIYSTDVLFDPADVDFVGQVNLLDPDGRTVYTRHVHAHEDKSLWLNPAFGALDMLDKTVTRVAEFIAKDAELRRLTTVHARHRTDVASGQLPIRRDQPSAADPASRVTPGEEAVIAPSKIRAVPGKDQAP